jgi:hypothetical protein
VDGVDLEQVEVELNGLDESTAARNRPANAAKDDGDVRGSAAIKIPRRP